MTFQAVNIEEAKWLYDNLTPITPMSLKPFDEFFHVILLECWLWVLQLQYLDLISPMSANISAYT